MKSGGVRLPLLSKSRFSSTKSLMSSDDTPLRITVNEPVGENITVRARSPAPVMSSAPPDPEPSVPAVPILTAPPTSPPAPPDATLSALANPSKLRASVPDDPLFAHVALDPSMNVSGAPAVMGFDESSLPLPGDIQLPPEWNDQTPAYDPAPTRNEDPWDTGVEEPKTVQLPDPEAQAKALEKERDELLFKLDCLQKQGVELPKKFNHTSSIDEMRSVYERFHRSQQMESGLQISRKLLIGFTGLIEWSNHRWDPMGAKLDGWSTNIMANVEEFDHALLRIWERYGSAMGDINPILELVFALAMSGVMYHFTQKRIDEEIRREEVDRDNPEFQAEVQRAAAEMFRARQEAERVATAVPETRSRSSRAQDQTTITNLLSSRARPPEPDRGPPAVPVYTNPEKARRDRELQQQRQQREQRAAAASVREAEARRRRETVAAYDENRNAPVRGRPAGASFNPAGLLSSVMGGAGGNEQVQRMMTDMGVGPQGFQMPNFVPPTPDDAAATIQEPSEPTTTIPDRPSTPVYNPEPARGPGRPKKPENSVDI